jgi:SAM-dependent methyltransferase
MDWHKRFVQQAGWTEKLRHHLFLAARLPTAERVLEVGCGTGAVLSTLPTRAEIHGLDLDRGRLAEASEYAPQTLLTCGDALALPYPAGVFDIVFCHFLLLWVRDPLLALLEMKRVARPGGAVLALAEPDHFARADEPAALVQLGRWQTEALCRQGADPGLGSRLADLFRQAGIPVVEAGILQADAAVQKPDEAGRQLEWQVLQNDLRGFVPQDELDRLKGVDERAWQRGTRRLHIPTHFTWGRA